jgi:hypothetical protein
MARCVNAYLCEHTDKEKLYHQFAFSLSFPFDFVSHVMRPVSVMDKQMDRDYSQQTQRQVAEVYLKKAYVTYYIMTNKTTILKALL